MNIEHRTEEKRDDNFSCITETPTAQQHRNTETPASRTALFVGRIYPVKGLPLLLEAWARVRPSGWCLRLVGPDEGGHEEELKRLCGKMGVEWMEGRAGVTHPADLSPSAREEEESAFGGPALRDEVGRMRKSAPTVNRSLALVEFSGPLEGDALRKAYEHADLFILPSHTENFGMAIAEAMAHGLPVLTTHGRQTPVLHAYLNGDGSAVALRHFKQPARPVAKEIAK